MRPTQTVPSELRVERSRVRFEDEVTSDEDRWNFAPASALARLDAEPHRSAEIADEMGKTVAAVATFRARLIRDNGLLVEPARGQVQRRMLAVGVAAG